MEGSASRRVRRIRQFRAVRRRGRILLPGPSPASERRPMNTNNIRPPGPPPLGWRGWELKVGIDVEPQDAAAHTSIAVLVPAHTCVFHDKFDYRLKPKRYDEARTLLFGWKEAHRAGSVAFASSGLYGAGDAFCFPPGAPLTQTAPAAPSGRQIHKFVGSAVHRELEVLCCSRQCSQNRRDRRVDPRPTVPVRR